MKKFITPDELIINSDGKIYHLNLVPEQIADLIITVGDPNRVSAISNHFDSIEVKESKREFITHTGFYKGQRLTVISTGIGTDNVDITINELDALANIDFKTREIKDEKRVLSFIRVGTSGSIQPDVDLDSFVASAYGIGLDGLMHFYQGDGWMDRSLTNQFNEQMDPPIPAYCTEGHRPWFKTLPEDFHLGMTGTNTGFYGPQGRSLRIEAKLDLNQLKDFTYKGMRITNFEMETAAIYGLSNLLGHRAISFNVILANRAHKSFSTHPKESVDALIERSLHWIIETLS